MTLTLGELAARLPGARLSGPPDLAVSEVGYDSSRMGPGALFVAIQGLLADGNRFVDAALKRGALAVASEAEPQPGTPWLQVEEARAALAEDLNLNTRLVLEQAFLRVGQIS